MAEEQKTRIINLAEKSAPESGDFFAVDSQVGGSKKVPATALAKAEALDNAVALIQNPTKTLSGALCSFTDGAEMPVVACTAEIVPKQSGTGTPSPDNVRPISGWESVNVNVVGKNIVENIGTATTVSGLTITKNSDGLFTANGTSTAVVAWTINYNLATILKTGQQYILSGCTGGNYANTYSLRVADANGSAKAISVNGDASFTADGTAKSLQLLVRSGQTLNNVMFYPMIRLASDTDPTYEPYNGHTTTTSLGRTVYGGTLDVVSGVLTVTHAYKEYTGQTSEAWTASSWTKTNTFVAYSNVDIADSKKEGSRYMCITACNMLPLMGYDELRNADTNGITITGGLTASYTSIRIDKTVASTVAELQTYLASNPLTIVYELETPQTYTLTGQEVSTLLGDNNVWADSGDIEITYRRDISIVLENLENALSRR